VGARAVLAGAAAARTLRAGGEGTLAIAIGEGGYVRLGDDGWVLITGPRAEVGPLSLLVAGLGTEPAEPGWTARVADGAARGPSAAGVVVGGGAAVGDGGGAEGGGGAGQVAVALPPFTAALRGWAAVAFAPVPGVLGGSKKLHSIPASLRVDLYAPSRTRKAPLDSREATCGAFRL
jgi:hypothetical protein